MNHVLDFFRLSEAVPLILLICLLHFVGGQICGDHAAPRWWARGFAAAGFLFYAALAIDAWQPRTPSDFLTAGLQALLAMGTVHGLALVTLPIIRFMYVHVWAEPLQRQRACAEEQARRRQADQREREAEQRRQEKSEQKAQDERRRQEELANRPPPPTREERLASAQQRYDATLRMLASAGLDDTELQSARERAKQKYLREVDEIMQ